MKKLLTAALVLVGVGTFGAPTVGAVTGGATTGTAQCNAMWVSVTGTGSGSCIQ